MWGRSPFEYVSLEGNLTRLDQWFRDPFFLRDLYNSLRIPSPINPSTHTSSLFRHRQMRERSGYVDLRNCPAARIIPLKMQIRDLARDPTARACDMGHGRGTSRNGGDLRARWTVDEYKVTSIRFLPCLWYVLSVAVC